MDILTGWAMPGSGIDPNTHSEEEGLLADPAVDARGGDRTEADSPVIEDLLVAPADLSGQYRMRNSSSFVWERHLGLMGHRT